jgi:hypothetical protein
MRLTRGAGTPACRAGAHPGACARPTVVFGTRNQPGFDRVVFDVAGYAAQFRRVSNPVIVGFRLPERFAGSSEKLVGVAGGGAFKGSEQFGRRDFRKQQHVNVVGHYDPRSEIEMPEFYRPYEGLARREFAGRRVSCTGKTAVQVPRCEGPFVFRKLVWQPAARLLHDAVAGNRPVISQAGDRRRDESRRGRHERLRHEVIA